MPLFEQLAEWEGRPRALLVRHAAREEIRSARDIIDAQLTEAGHADAADFGETLTSFDAVRAMHSPILRCGQTAEGIVDGFSLAGGEATVGGPLPAIGGAYIRDPARVFLTFASDRTGFLRTWFDGRIPDDVIAPLPEVAQIQIDGIAAAWRGRDPTELQVFVTHDWNLLALREEVMGLRHEEAGWVEFLEGVVLTRHGDEIVFGLGGVEAARRIS
jgi:hypothetical protein